MAFDLLTRFRRHAPTHDVRGHQHVQRPPPMVARAHGRRPAPVAQARPQVRRGHHRDQHQPAPAAIPRAPPPMRKGPVMRAPAPMRKGPAMRTPSRPHPPQRVGPGGKLMNCLHIHFHPNQKRDLALPPLRSSKHTSQHPPPFPPPRGAIRAPPRHVHWAPAQAPLPSQPYPYPSHSSSRTPSYAPSHARTQHYQSPPPIPRYQPPQQPRSSRDLVVSHRRK